MFNQNGGSRTDTLIKLVLVFFLSLLSFSVGTFVGKQFSDGQHKMAELDNGGADSAERSTASIPPDATKAEPNQAISEEEISKLSDEFVQKEKQENTVRAKDTDTAKNNVEGASEGLKGQAIEAEPAPVAKKAVEKKAVSIHDEIADVSKKLASGVKVIAPKQEASRIPSSLPKETAGSTIGKYTVQISSHSSENEAKAKAAEFKEKGFSAFYVPAPVNGATWYRVSVGLFDTKKEATEYRGKLMKEANVASAIVQKISK